ncbi:MAG: hypothetical protein KJZ60_10545 [Ignavibacteriaceae bacterium]|nr:hypothetical protein [Ignavibacteriaceae bacterium]
MNEELEKIPEQSNSNQKQNELTLPELIKLAEPLIKSWTENDNEKHRRELDFENNILKESSRQNRLTTIGIFIISGLVLFISGVLFYIGRDSTAMDLINLGVGFGGALLGGYGYARTKSNSRESDK